MLIPGLVSYKDFDISVEIGHQEYLGAPLTLKHLLALDIASEATVRRHLKNLIKDGLIDKKINPKDNRSVVFTLTDKAHLRFQDCINQLISILTDLT
ncbi:MAG: hypothetical protein GQ475_04115 [Methylococcaceae bacterium]|nr:hypothetical protein [Methylococcaceae bacterium]